MTTYPPSSNDPLEAGGARRWILGCVAVMEVAAGVWLIRFAHETAGAWVSRGLGALLIIGGSALFVLQGRWFRGSLLFAFLVFVLPIVAAYAFPEVDRDTVALPLLGEMDADGIATVWMFRLLLEGPLWTIYWLLVAAHWRWNARKRTQSYAA